MPFSSTQPSLRARILPKFPARVVAGNGITITQSGGVYTFTVTNQIGGSTTQIQYNDVGVFNGDSTFTFNKTTKLVSCSALTATGNVTAGGVIISAGYVQTGTATVATLPAAGTKGRRSFVTDANATTFASIVAGGGANNVPVYDDGTNWRIG